MKGFLIAAPSSGSGKTTITIGLLAALRARGLSIRSAKSGPDYIDGRFHEAVTGHPCINLDAWAMAPNRLRQLAETKDHLIVEGAMGLFDGAPPNGEGSAAALAKHLGLPVILVVDAARQSQSIAALLHGFMTYDPDIKIGGVIFNRVGSQRHDKMLQNAVAQLNTSVLGAIPNTKDLHRPARHLGLVQAIEHNDLSDFIGDAMSLVAQNLDLDLVEALFEEGAKPNSEPIRLRPPAQSIAIARDDAFDFLYPHFLKDWHEQGAALSFFSPLNDEAPAKADLVFLPGGYPELHAGKLAANQTFMNGLQQAHSVYGECGGYMVMGDGLIDAEGRRHKMAGLLRLETSFETRIRHLGYRNIKPRGGPWQRCLKGHEFHYSTELMAKGEPLFEVSDAEGNNLASTGLFNGNYSGSYLHVIDAVSSDA